jgi:hypothetical protein
MSSDRWCCCTFHFFLVMLAREYDEGVEDLAEEEAPLETGPATYPRHMRVDLRKLSVRGQLRAPWVVHSARGECWPTATRHDP